MATASPDAVISHWSKLVENLQASPLAFYASVEAAIQKRQIPEIATERVEYKEGGAVSARREYLRVKRGKHVFDICAAPFGTGFFFSSWLAEVPVLTRLHKFLIFAALAGALSLFMARSFFVGPFQFLLFLFVALFLLSLGESGFDDAILELPGIGWVYGRVFKPTTYYKIDTALMFQAAVHDAVIEAIDGLTNAQGIRAMTELERKPVLKKFATA